MRRGDTLNACYAAYEFFLFRSAYDNDPTGVRRLNTNFIHRYQVILLEDIGPAVIPHLPRLANRFTTWRSIDAQPAEALSTMFSDIHFLCSMYKSRSCSFARAYSFSSQAADEASRYQWEECKVVKHYFTGESEDVVRLANSFINCLVERNRLAIYFGFELAKSAPTGTYSGKSRAAQGFPGESLVWHCLHVYLESICNTQLECKHALKVLREWYNKDLHGIKEAFLCWLSIVLYLIQPFTSKVDVNELSSSSGILEYCSSPHQFDEFVFDMHTKEGKRDIHRKSSAYFAQVSSLVIPEDPHVDKEMKDIYIKSKISPIDMIAPINKVETLKAQPTITPSTPSTPVSSTSSHSREDHKDKVAVIERYGQLAGNGEVVSEKEFLQLRARVQLVTSNGKTDTYYAVVQTTGGPLSVFVKGPFADVSHVKAMVDSCRWKKELGLPSYWTAGFHLCVDQFAESDCALGVRRKMIGKTAWFCVSEDIVGFDTHAELPTYMHSSEKWKPTSVVDFSQCDVRGLTIADLSDVGVCDAYLQALMYRHLVGIPDQACRNFLLHTKTNSITSVDESDVGKEAKVHTICKSAKKAISRVIKARHLEEYNNMAFHLNKPALKGLGDLISIFQL